MSKPFKLGDRVRERDGVAVGEVVHVLDVDPNLVAVCWPGNNQAFVFHRDDLIRVNQKQK